MTAYSKGEENKKKRKKKKDTKRRKPVDDENTRIRRMRKSRSENRAAGERER